MLPVMTCLYMKEDLRKQIDPESDTTVVFTSPPSKMMYVVCYMYVKMHAPWSIPIRFF